jgi:hypothetical protein
VALLCLTVREHCAPGLVAGRYQPLADDVTIAGDVRPNLSSAVDSEDKAKRTPWNRFASASAGTRRRDRGDGILPLPPEIDGLCPRFPADYSGRK